MKIPGSILLGVMAATLLAGAAWAVPGYRMLNSIKLGGDTFWDAITFDGVHRHLFITHGGHVVVLNSDTLAPAGDIRGVEAAHQVAIASDLGKGYATAGKLDAVIVFDAASLKITGKIAVGGKPDGVVYDPATKHVFTFNAGSRDATAIDARSGTVAGTVPLGGKPEFAVADGAGHIFDNIENTSEIVEIDAQALSVMHRWKLAPCREPSGLAIDKQRHRLFAACGNAMMAVVNADTGAVIATIPTGKGSDGAEYDPVTRYVFIPNGEGEISVIRQDNGDRYAAFFKLPTALGARTMAIDASSHRLFTVTAGLTPNPGEKPPYKITPGTFRLLVYGR